MTQATHDTDDTYGIVRCTKENCDFAEAAESKVHAHALGRRHWNRKGHAVCMDGGDE